MVLPGAAIALTVIAFKIPGDLAHDAPGRADDNTGKHLNDGITK
jgi:hypothetical protein